MWEYSDSVRLEVECKSHSIASMALEQASS